MTFELDIHMVGRHLQNHAHNFAGDERDAYARSAFNRYYYSIFLRTRSLFSSLDPAWSRKPHAEYPTTLRVSVKKQLKKAWTRARKGGDAKLMRDIEAAFRSIEALSVLLEKAYAIRVVADYEPEQIVEFHDSNRFSLKEVEITSAHGWRARCDMFCNEILNAWMQANA